MTTITIQETINHLIARQDLTTEQMTETMRAIMTGACTPAQIAGILVALRMKGETVDEISAAARVMRELSERVDVSPEHLVDTCGTGGDGSHTFNISTTAAFVTAAAGARVAKHGNRSVSSKSGSADVLEAAGINLQLGPEQVADCIEKIGIGFMFAPMHHSAMKHAITPRKELGTRTLFNLLGPLTNPAAAPNQVLGVFDDDWLEKLAQVLQKLGSEHVLVVHAEDGLDEISIAAATHICELCKGKIHRYTITPEQFGLQRNSIENIESGNVENSLEILYSVLDNIPGPARDIVLMNAGAAIYAAGVADTLESGMGKADEAIRDGSARNKLDDMKHLTNTY